MANSRHRLYNSKSRSEGYRQEVGCGFKLADQLVEVLDMGLADRDLL